MAVSSTLLTKNKVGVLRRLVRSVYYLYVQLDRRLREHFPKVLDYSIGMNLPEKEIAQLAYLLKVCDTITRIIKSLIQTPNASTIPRLTISNVLNELDYLHILHNVTSVIRYKGLAVLSQPEISYNLPEYIVIKSLVIELYRICKNVLDAIDSIIPIQPWLNEVRKLVEGMLVFLKDVLEKTFLAYVSYKPFEYVKHVVQLVADVSVRHSLSELLKCVDELRDVKAILSKVRSVTASYSDKVKIVYTINVDRLYEVYVLLLLLLILSRKFKFVGIHEHCDATCFSFSSDDVHIDVAYNQRNSLVSKARLSRVRSLSYSTCLHGNISRYVGIPDIIVSVYSKHGNYQDYIIIECKFRFSIKSIVESRYKVLGYMLEYDVANAMLVFPKLIRQSNDIVEHEVYINHELIVEACRNGIVLEYCDRSYKRLCLVCVDPRYVEDSVNALEKALNYLGIATTLPQSRTNSRS